MIGYECTIPVDPVDSVDSVDEIAAAVDAHGGRVLVPKFEIPTVGVLIEFEDTEGNVACAMRYSTTGA